MSRLPPDVRLLGRWLLPPEAAEVILGDLEEEASERPGDRNGFVTSLWLRWELARSVAAVWRDALGRRLLGPPRGTRVSVSGIGKREVGMGGVLQATCEDFRQTLRSLLRSPAFTVFAAGTLALGVGSATAVYSAMERVVFNPLPYPDSDRMAVLWRTTDGDVIFAPQAKHLPVWSELDAFEGMEAYQAGSRTLTGRGVPTVLRMKSVTPGYFRFLGVRPLLGRGFQPEEHRDQGARSVLLSHEFWTTAFGRSPDVLGATLTLDDEPWTIVGVLPPRVYPPNSGPGLTDVWTPLGSAAEGTVWPVTRLRPGTTLEEANERLAVLAEGASEAGLGPPVEWRGKAFDAASFGRGRVADQLRVLFTGVLLLLLVAVVNVTNLFLRRTSQKEKERAVRATLGAGRPRLLRQVVLESLVISALGGVAALALAYGLLALVESLRPETMDWLLNGLRMDSGVLFFTLGASVAAGLLASVFPALRFTTPGRSLTSVLRGPTAPDGTGGRAGARWALVSVEIALSFALLTGTLAVAGALNELTGRDPGFEVDGLVEVQVSLPDWRYEEEADRRGVFEEMAAELQRSPGVAAVGLADGIPPGLPGILAQPQAEGGEPADETTFVRSAETPAGILGLLEQPLLAGRDLQPADAEDGARPVLVGRALARRLFPGAAPAEVVGRRFTLEEGEEPLTIVGVAGDVRVNGLARDAGVPLVYRPRTSWQRSQVLVVRLDQSIDPERWESGAEVRPRLLSLAPEAVVEVRTTDEAMDRTLAQERFTALLLSGFALLALLLAGVGMYGVLSQAVTGRTREIGIRMSLGADGQDIRRLILGGGGTATAAGLMVGGILAWLGLGHLVGFGVGPDALRPRAFLLSSVVLAGVALAAIWLPARRATRLDPKTAIRT